MSLLDTIRSLFSKNVLGADISFNNRYVSMAGAKKDGVVFLGIRWGQRDGKNGYSDSYAKQNWTNAKKEEVDRFAYWVWDELDENTGKRFDAQDHFNGVVAVYDVYTGELPFCADLELEPLDWDEFHNFLMMLEDWTGRVPLVYCGAWYYERVEDDDNPLPKWLEDYIHWLTGYNDTGPSVWGPIAELDIEIVCWQQANNWQVDWAENKAVDRNYWIKDYKKYLKNGGDTVVKVVNSDDLRTWISANEYDESVPIPPPTPTPEKFKLIWPTEGDKVVTQWYGINPQWYNKFGLPGHEGLDMRAVGGADIYAAADGEVVRVEDNPNSGPYGIHVRIMHIHDGQEYKTVYAHFERTKVNVGDKVVAGTLVGLSDNTGNSSGAHLHFTLKVVGKGSPWLSMSDIVNPVPYFPDLFPECTIPGFGGSGWRVDVGGNFRTSPRLEPNNANLIRYIGAGNNVIATGEVDWDGGGDWWEIEYDNVVGWFWNPGYKFSAR